MTFGENLARLRKKAGLSQEELAGKLNLTRQTVSKWETGQSEPDLASLTRLCQLLDAGPEELLGQRPRKEKAAPTDWPVVMDWAFLICAFLAGVVIFTVLGAVTRFKWPVLLMLEMMMVIPPLIFAEIAIRRVFHAPLTSGWALVRMGSRCLLLSVLCAVWVHYDVKAEYIFHIGEAPGILGLLICGALLLLLAAAEPILWYIKKRRGKQAHRPIPQRP